MELVGHVASLWRYPVKSMGGEPCEQLLLEPEGVCGDRRFALLSSGAALGRPLVTGQERAYLLRCHARTVGPDGEAASVRVTLPDGSCYRCDDPALLTAIARGAGTEHRLTLQHSPRPHTECRPVALLSSQTIATVSAEAGETIGADRFRANILLDLLPPRASFAEDAFENRPLHLGRVVVMVRERTPRCRVVTVDPGSGERQPELMRLLARRFEGRVGIYGTPLTAGRLAAGDPVFLD